MINQVMELGPHLTSAQEYREMFDRERKHNYKVYRENKKSLDRGEAFVRSLKLAELLKARPRAEPKLLLSNVDFVPPNDAERILGYAIYM